MSEVIHAFGENGELSDGAQIALDNFMTSTVNPAISMVAVPTGGTAGQVLTSDGAGGRSWETPATGGVTIKVGGSQPAAGWWLDTGTPEPDAVAPSTPTGLTATATGGSTVDLSWNASTDNIGVAGYNYRIGTGAAVNAGAGTTETVTGLSPLTAYSFQVQAYDAQGNVSGWSTAASATTLEGPDTTAPTPGTLAASAITSTTFTLTVTGASDAGGGLHATPYAFSTDNGATWTAYQSSNVYNVTGRTASTAYQARHKVRDAAGNEALGTAITVTTSAPTPLVTDDFNRANTTSGGTLGTTSDGTATWVDPGSCYKITNNKARAAVTTPSISNPARLENVTPTSDQRVDVKMGIPDAPGGAVRTVTLLARLDTTTNQRYQLNLSSPVTGNAVFTLIASPSGTGGVINGGGSHPTVDLGRALVAGEEFAVSAIFKEEGGGTRVIITRDGGTPMFNLLHTDATRPQGRSVGLHNAQGAHFDDLQIFPA